MATSNTHEIEIKLSAGSLNTDNIKKQIDEIEKQAKIDIKTEFGKDFKDKTEALMDAVKQLEKINKLMNGSWTKTDLVKAMTDIGQALNDKEIKKDANAVAVMNQHLLVMVNALKQMDDTYKNSSWERGKGGLNFEKLFQNAKVDTTDKNIKNLLATLNTLRNGIADFTEIESIPLGSLIGKDEVRQLFSRIDNIADDVAEQFSKAFGENFKVKIKNSLKISDFLSKELANALGTGGNGGEIGVGLKPTISNPKEFIGEASEILKKSGEKLSVEIKPAVSDSQKFKSELVEIGNQLRRDGVNIDVEVNPRIAETERFKNQIETISNELKKSGIEIGVGVKPDEDSVNAFANKIASGVSASNTSTKTADSVSTTTGVYDKDVVDKILQNGAIPDSKILKSINSELKGNIDTIKKGDKKGVLVELLFGADGYIKTGEELVQEINTLSGALHGIAQSGEVDSAEKYSNVLEEIYKRLKLIQDYSTSFHIENSSTLIPKDSELYGLLQSKEKDSTVIKKFNENRNKMTDDTVTGYAKLISMNEKMVTNQDGIQSQINAWEEYRKKILDSGKALLDFNDTYNELYKRKNDDGSDFINWSDSEKTLENIKNRLKEIYELRKQYDDPRKYEKAYGNEVIALKDILDSAGYSIETAVENKNISKFLTSNAKFLEAKEMLKLSSDAYKILPDNTSIMDLYFKSEKDFNTTIDERIKLLREELPLLRERNEEMEKAEEHAESISDTESKGNKKSKSSKPSGKKMSKAELIAAMQGEQQAQKPESPEQPKGDDGEKPKIGVELVPKITDPSGFSKEAEKIFDESGEKVGVQIKPVNKDNEQFKRDIEYIEERLKADGIKIGLEIKPSYTDKEKFDSAITQVQESLDKDEIKIGIGVKPIYTNKDEFVAEVNSIEQQLQKDGIDIGIKVKPIFGDSNEINSEIDNIKEQAKASGEGIDIETKPSVTDNGNFQMEINTIEENIRRNGIRLGVDIKPTLTDEAGFQTEITNIENRLTTKVGVDIKPNENTVSEFIKEVADGIKESGGLNINDIFDGKKTNNAINNIGTNIKKDIYVNESDLLQTEKRLGSNKEYLQDQQKYIERIIEENIKKSEQFQNNIIKLRNDIQSETNDSIRITMEAMVQSYIQDIENATQVIETKKRELTAITNKINVIENTNIKTVPDMDGLVEDIRNISNSDGLETQANQADELANRVENVISFVERLKNELNGVSDAEQSSLDSVNQQQNITSSSRTLDIALNIINIDDIKNTIISALENLPVTLEELNETQISKLKSSIESAVKKIQILEIEKPEDISAFKTKLEEAIGSVSVDTLPNTANEKIQAFKTKLIEAINTIDITTSPNTNDEKIQSFKDKLIQAINEIDITTMPDVSPENIQTFKSRLVEAIGVVDVQINPVIAKSGSNEPVTEIEAVNDVIENNIIDNEEILKQKSVELAQEMVREFGLTKKSVTELSDVILQMFKNLQNGEKNISSESFKKILFGDRNFNIQDKKWLDEYNNSWNSPKVIRQYLRGKKINIDSKWASDFGDEYKSVKSTISPGRAMFVKSGGSSLNSILEDMNHVLGTTFDLTKNPSDLLRSLYDSVSKKDIDMPQYIDSIKGSLDDFVQHIKDSYNTIITEKNKLNEELSKPINPDGNLPVIDVEIQPLISAPDDFKQKIREQVGTVDIDIKPNEESVKSNMSGVMKYWNEHNSFPDGWQDPKYGSGVSNKEYAKVLGGRFEKMYLNDTLSDSYKLDIEFFRDLINELDLSTDKATVLKGILAELDSYMREGTEVEHYDDMWDNLIKAQAIIQDYYTIRNQDVVDAQKKIQEFSTDNNVPVEIKPQVSKPEEFAQTIRDAVGVVDIPVKPVPSENDSLMLGDIINTEKTLVTGAVGEEVVSFDTLSNKIRQDVIPAIGEKTKAFEDEAARVTNVVDNETSEFQILFDIIKNISEELKQSLSFDNGIVNTIRTLQESLASIYNSGNGSIDFSGLINLFNAVKDAPDFSKFNFPSLTSFLKSISSKTTDEVNAFVENLRRIRDSIKGLSDKVEIKSFGNISALNELGSAVKSFPNDTVGAKFAMSTRSIAAGFKNLKDGLKDIGSGNSDATSVLAIINEMLSKADALKDMASILNKTPQITREAKANSNAQNQRLIGDRSAELKKITQAYVNEFETSVKNTGTGVVNQTTIDTYQNAINQLKELRNAANITESQIKQIDKTIESSENTINNLGKVLENIRTTELSQINVGSMAKQIESVEKALKSVGRSDDGISNLTKNLRSMFEIISSPATNDQDRFTTLKQYKEELNNLYRTIEAIKERMKSDKDYENRIKQAIELNNEVEKYHNLEDKIKDSSMVEQKSILEQIKNDYSDINKSIENGTKLKDKDIDKLKEENRVLEATMKYQSGQSFLNQRIKFSGGDTTAYANTLDNVKNYITQTLSTQYKSITKQVATDTQQSINGIKTLTAQVKDHEGNIKNLTFTWAEASGAISWYAKDGGKAISGLTGILDKLKKKTGEVMAYWVGNFLNPFRIVGFVRQGISVVQEYDDAMVEMRKVSNETEESLQRFAKTSYDVANSVGTTALQIQKSTGDFLRIGYDLKQASEAASEANVLLNVSEFQNIEDATNALISMKQAYQDLGAREIIDELNIVGNNFAISTSELAQGMQNAAAALKTQGNSFEEALALITAGNTVIQDVSKVSAGIRTISLRVASSEIAKKQLDELGEDTSDYIVQTRAKLQQTIKDLTKTESNKEGVNIVDPNGSLKSTYQILLDISQVYKDIQEEDKKAGTNRAAALVEQLAGSFARNIRNNIVLIVQYVQLNRICLTALIA